MRLTRQMVSAAAVLSQLSYSPSLHNCSCMHKQRVLQATTEHSLICHNQTVSQPAAGGQSNLLQCSQCLVHPLCSCCNTNVSIQPCLIHCFCLTLNCRWHSSTPSAICARGSSRSRPAQQQQLAAAACAVPSATSSCRTAAV
jgi:hypothetical protein